MNGQASLLRYGALGIPLAFAGLPIYLHIPHLYATAYHMDLAAIGFILLVIRAVDAFQDPLIGLLCDRSRLSRRRIVILASLPLTCAFIGLFHPPAWVQYPTSLGWWLGGMMMIVSTAFTVMMIQYYASGMNYGEAMQTRLSAFREGGILLGVMLASILPTVLIEQVKLPVTAAYAFFSLALMPLMGAGLFVSHGTLSAAVSSPASRPRLRDGFELLKVPAVTRTLLLFFCNALPSAITSTLFLFFVSDVLHASGQSGGFLLTYFIAAGGSVPCWAWLAERWNPDRVLAAGMTLAIISFIGAYFLVPGDTTAFYVICGFSGIAMGADTTLLPVLFAYALRRHSHASAFAYSLWHGLSKLTLAFAAGVVLPLLAWWGYQPAELAGPSQVQALRITYAVIPCLLKGVSLIVLLRLSSLSTFTKESL